MAEEASTADHAAAEALPVWTHTPGGAGPLSPHEAARSLADGRNKMLAGERPKEDTQAASADTATPAQESEAVEAAEDAAHEDGPGETPTEADPAEDLPSIEPPRSWTKEDKEVFTGLPRETQERLVERERSRETDFLRRQNEAADKLKGLTAKEQAAEQARQQYETASINTLNVLFELQNSQFPEVKSFADAQKLAQDDPTRYVQWRSNQDLIEAKRLEVAGAQQQRQSEFKQQWSDYGKAQDQLLNDAEPELKDKAVAKKLTEAANVTLQGIGFKPEELGQAWDGQASLSLRDHRVQRLILKATKYDELMTKQATVKDKVAAKVLPPVQRPGAAKPANAGAASEVKNLQAQLGKSTGMASLRIASQLAAAQRRASQ